MTLPADAPNAGAPDAGGHEPGQSTTQAPTTIRVLLLGASGRLGSAIERSLSARHVGRTPRLHVDAPSRQALALDCTNPYESVGRWFERWRPELVVDCIAMSDVDRCETEPDLAHRLNGALPAALARASKECGARLVHFSSDFVFDGGIRRPYLETDPPNPVSVYGASKLAGERAILAQACQHWIFRISWLYGSAKDNLAARLLEPASAGRAIALANDRFGVPNPVQWIAAEVVQCIERCAHPVAPRSGVYHLTCRGVTTWHAFGLAFLQEALRLKRMPASPIPRIEALDESSLARAAQRPNWSALDAGRYEKEFGRLVPDWKSAIRFALEGCDATAGSIRQAERTLTGTGSHPISADSAHISYERASLWQYDGSTLFSRKRMPRQSYESIRKQIDKLEAQARKIEEAQGEKKKKAVAQVVSLMKKVGVTLDDIGASGPRGRGARGARAAKKTPGKAARKTATKKPVAPKFRNTKTGETWSGRGRTPRWLVALEAQGKSREDYRI